MAFDDRLLRVTVEIGDETLVYEDVFISASGTKYGNQNQNECEIKITNLSKPHRDTILTEASPYNLVGVPKRVKLEAGRRSTGYSELFIGDITEAKPSQPPDIVLTIKALTGNGQKGKITAVSHGANASLEQIAQSAADRLGLSLVMQAKPKTVKNYAYSGAALQEIDNIESIGGVNAYVDDGKLVVKEMNVPLSDELRVLNKQTGMIGIPEFTEQGVKVKFLLDNVTNLGGGLQIESEMNPAVNGTYVIYKLNFEVSNRDTPFYFIAEAKRLGAP